MKMYHGLLTLLFIFWASISTAQVTDPNVLAKTLFLEAIRANPDLLEGQQDFGIKAFALNTYVEPGINKTLRTLPHDEQQAKLDMAGAWIKQQIGAPSALPLEAEIFFPASIRVNGDGSLLLGGSLGNSLDVVTGSLDAINIRAPGQTPNVIIRPVQPFNLTSMQPEGGAKAKLEELSRTRQGVMVIARLTVEEMNIALESRGAVAGGKVTSVAIHELKVVDRQRVPGARIWTLPVGQVGPKAISRADVERAMKLTKENGHYQNLREGAVGQLTQLMAWRALTEIPVEKVLEQRLETSLFWFAYSQLAPRSLQDALIPPHKLDQHRRTFAPTVNAIEKRGLEDNAIRALWPQIAAAMPKEPLPVLTTSVVPMSQYDFDKGGFSVTFRSGGWLLGTQYPILTGLPEFLKMGEAEANQILDRMAQIDGPGRNQLTLRALMDVSVRSVSSAPDGPLRQPQIVPGFDLKQATVHVAGRHPTDQSLMQNKVMDLDIARFRGPEQPVADKNALSRWATLAQDKGARGEDLIAAAMAVTDDAEGLSQAMNRQGQQSDALGAAQSLKLPDPAILTGQITFRNQNGVWNAEGFRYNSVTNESRLNVPQVELADSRALADLALTDEQAEALRAVGGRVNFRGVFQPVTAAVKGSRVSVYIRFSELALFSAQKDETGLPLFRVLLTPEPPAAPVVSTDLSKRPEVVQLDHDYLDLLQIRQFGDEVDDASLDRMLLDRLYRELRTTDEAELPWGRFFEPMPERLNRVERAAFFPAFRAWQGARAEALPESVVVRVATNAAQAGCATLTYAHPSQANAFSAGVKQALEASDYAAVAQSVGTTLGMLEAALRTAPDRAPLLVPQRLTHIGGRPVYQLLGTSRHPSVNHCTGQIRMDSVTDGFDPARSQTTDAVIVLKNPVLVPQERRQVVETRHTARVADIAFQASGTKAGADGPRHAGTFRITLDVTEGVFYDQNALPTRYQPNPTGTPVRISVAQVAGQKVAPPKVADIKNMTLGTSAEDMEAALSADGAQQRKVAQSFVRQVAPTSVPGLGMLPATEAYTEAVMLIDATKEEVILSLSDRRTGAPRVGLGRVKLYDPAKLTADGLIGALVKKYGEPAQVEDSRRGGAAGKRLLWGYDPALSLPQCLPQMHENPARKMRAAFDIRTDEDRIYFDLAQALPWPHFGPLTEGVPDLSTCGETVVAEVSQYRGKLSLSVWVMNPSLLAKLDWQSAAPKSAKDLADEAADVDL